MIYNYRFDRSQLPNILKRLRTKHLLSQGWGGGMDADLNLRDPEFVERCVGYYKLVTTRVPSNLTKIRDLKRGDVLVTPHLPGNGQVSIHVVADNYPDCYNYEPKDETHQNHRIAIEQSYGLDGEVNIHNICLSEWYGKLQWLRLPLLPIPSDEKAFRGVIDQLNKSPRATFGASKLDEYLSQLRNELMTHLKTKLRKISSSNSEISFEAVCERLLVSAGYQVINRRQYDRRGGDVDLECVRNRSYVSLFETGQTRLYVQIKKYVGETDERPVKQLLPYLKQDPLADGCVMSLGDSFSSGARDLAEEHGINLMTGDIVCGLLIEQLARLGDEA